MNRIALAAALAASLSCFAAAPAAAEEVTVAYGDLNVATPTGAEILAHRVATGVDTVCARPDLRDLKAMADFNACKDAAVSSVTEQLNEAHALFGASQLVALAD